MTQRYSHGDKCARNLKDGDFIDVSAYCPQYKWVYVQNFTSHDRTDIPSVEFDVIDPEGTKLLVLNIPKAHKVPIRRIRKPKAEM